MYPSQGRTSLAVNKQEEPLRLASGHQFPVKKTRAPRHCTPQLGRLSWTVRAVLYHYGKFLAIGGPKNCVRPSGILFQNQIAARYRGFSGFSCKTFSPERIQ